MSRRREPALPRSRMLPACGFTKLPGFVFQTFLRLPPVAGTASCAYDATDRKMILSLEYRRSFWKEAGIAAKKCWNLPNTIVGLLWGMLGVAFGAKVTIGNNAIQFENHPFMFWGAITIGNTIS